MNTFEYPIVRLEPPQDGVFGDTDDVVVIENGLESFFDIATYNLYGAQVGGTLVIESVVPSNPISSGNFKSVRLK